MKKLLIFTTLLFCGCTSTQWTNWGTVLGHTARGFNEANSYYQTQNLQNNLDQPYGFTDTNCFINCTKQNNLPSYCRHFCNY